MGSLKFCSLDCDQLCYCLCLFDAIIELHAMNEKNAQCSTFSLESESGSMNN
jgi:hypothetical protein